MSVKRVYRPDPTPPAEPSETGALFCEHCNEFERQVDRLTADLRIANKEREALTEALVHEQRRPAKLTADLEAMTEERDVYSSWHDIECANRKTLAATVTRLRGALEDAPKKVCSYCRECWPIAQHDNGTWYHEDNDGEYVNACSANYLRTFLDAALRPEGEDYEEYIPKGHHVVTDADGERYVKNEPPEAPDAGVRYRCEGCGATWDEKPENHIEFDYDQEGNPEKRYCGPVVEVKP